MLVIVSDVRTGAGWQVVAAVHEIDPQAARWQKSGWRGCRCRCAVGRIDLHAVAEVERDRVALARPQPADEIVRGAVHDEHAIDLIAERRQSIGAGSDQVPLHHVVDCGGVGDRHAPPIA